MKIPVMFNNPINKKRIWSVIYKSLLTKANKQRFSLDLTIHHYPYLPKSLPEQMRAVLNQ